MSINDFDDPSHCAELQWGQAALGDQRRTGRAVRRGAALAAQPAASLPQQAGSWAEVKAAYPLLNQPAVTHQALSRAHRQATRRRAAEAGQATLLFVQDASELDFTRHPRTRGPGWIGNTGGRGFLVHSCLAARPAAGSPSVLGLAAQQVWTRHEVKKGRETRAARRGRRTEADVWAEVVEAIGRAPAPESGTRWVSAGDRASDVFSYFRRARAVGWHCLVRVSQDRVITTGSGARSRRLAWARGLEPRAHKRLRWRGRDGAPRRQVTLQVAWAALSTCAPQLGPERGAAAVAGWCIRCREEGAAAGRVEWVLFSAVAVAGAAQAPEQVEWYACRWVIEEYHECLKTGRRIEARQLERAAGLLALPGLLSIVAVRLPQLRHPARAEAGRPARQVVAGRFVEVVQARLGGRVRVELTLGQFWHGVAGLGGFLGRKSDGEPGWQALWRGRLRLQDMCWGAAHAHD